MRTIAALAAVQAGRDRWLLAIWILGIALLGLAAAGAVATEFASERERSAIIAVAVANPAFLFLRGVPDGTSVGAVVFFQAYAFTAVLAGLMSTFLVVRHSRADEELGRAELISATPVPRAASLAATIALGAGANIVLGVLVATGLLAAGLPIGGSSVYGAAVGAVGVVFVGIAAVLAQVMPSGRSANGAAAAFVGLAYLVRGFGDALGTGADLTHVISAWPSWLSPIGWGQRTTPFSAADATPLFINLAVAVALGGLALFIRTRRDLGASLVRERMGRERSSVTGRSLAGLSWRLHRATLLGWCVGAATLGAVAGGLGPVVADAVEGNSSLRELIASLVPGVSAGITDVFAAALLGIGGVLAAAAGVQAILRLRAEESEGRAEWFLSAPVSRVRWLAVNLLVGALSVVVVSATAGVVAGAALGASGEELGMLGKSAVAALAHVPAALVFVALAGVVFAVAPRLTIPVGWGLLTIGLILGQFGELLRLPLWLQDLSPFRHSSALPVEDLDVMAALVLTGIAVLGGSLAAAMIGRRDLVA